MDTLVYLIVSFAWSPAHRSSQYGHCKKSVGLLYTYRLRWEIHSLILPPVFAPGFRRTHQTSVLCQHVDTLLKVMRTLDPQPPCLTRRERINYITYVVKSPPLSSVAYRHLCMLNILYTVVSEVSKLRHFRQKWCLILAIQINLLRKKRKNTFISAIIYTDIVLSP